MSGQKHVAVVVFPGTNCDREIGHVYERLLGQKVTFVWHREEKLPGVDAVVLPGGFSFGDYLRTGALAAHSPVVRAVKGFAADGGAVLGICNGFQILCESGLLPGVLRQNRGMKFLSRFVGVRVECVSTPFTREIEPGTTMRLPVAHGDGCYYAEPAVVEELEATNRVVFRYTDLEGRTAPDSLEANPNGSVNAIAGICNEVRNVVGLMPHPERAAEPKIGALGGAGGLQVLRSLLAA